MDFIFITYIIALLGLAAGLYAILSVRELEKSFRGKESSRPRNKKPLPPIKVERAKGHWD